MANQSSARSGAGFAQAWNHFRQHLLDAPLVDSEEQVLLGGEVGIDRTLGVARPLGDLVHRGGVEPAADEACLGRGDELLAGLLAPLQPGEPHRHTITIRIPIVLKYYRYSDAASISMSRHTAEHVFYHFRDGRIAVVSTLIDRTAIEAQLRMSICSPACRRPGEARQASAVVSRLR